MSYAMMTYTYEKRLRRALHASEAAYIQARTLGDNGMSTWYYKTRTLHSMWKLDS